MPSPRCRSQSPPSSVDSNRSSPSLFDRPLTQKEFVQARRKQDDQLKREFDNIHTQLNQNSADTQRNSIDIQRNSTDIQRNSTEIEKLTARLDQVSTTLQQLLTSTYNARVRNPLMPIRPLPAYHPGSGETIFPKYFPRTAKHFFELKNPSSDRQMARLLSLVRFYDVDIFATWADDEEEYAGQEVDDDDSEDSGSGTASQEYKNRMTVEEATRRFPEKAVEVLSLLFGLDEDVFLDFTAKARAFASNPPISAGNKHNRVRFGSEDREAKRVELSKQVRPPREGLQDLVPPLPLGKDGLPLQQSSSDGKAHSDRSVETRLDWRNSPSLPDRSSKPTILRLGGTKRNISDHTGLGEHQHEPQQHESLGSPTNEFSSPPSRLKDIA